MLQAQTELRYLKGVGPQRAAALAAQGIETLEDLLYLLPFRYEDRRAFAVLADLERSGVDRTVSVRVVRARLIRTRRRGFSIFRAEVEDESASLPVVWFNQPYLERVIVAGRRVVLFGRLGTDRSGGVVLDNPEYELLDDEDAEGVHTGRIVPVYRKTADLGSRRLRALMFHALAEVDPTSLREVTPPLVAGRHGILGRLEALRGVHFPPDGVGLDALAERRTLAQRSLAFEEIFVLQLGLAVNRRRLRREQRGIRYEIPDALRTRLARMLPFRLTPAQHRVLREIGEDLRSSHPMNRLLQGDVGSGKTIVAVLTMLVAVENGYQAALMAPTEILAEQHARSLRALLEQGGLDTTIALLTGSLRVPARRAVLGEIASGRAQLVVGTHALFEAGVEFRRLGLAVVDEQHRFGVLQRAALADKGPRPDVLVMTATPIPRSLALTLYGDLDLSLIDELPPQRRPVTTVVREEPAREKVYSGLCRELERGRQAYVVVPLVEETAKLDLKAATAFAEKLRQGPLRGFADRIGLLHGRMSASDRDAVMRAFVRGELSLLVATTVIEVGVDVPAATVMIVEHAERFGLSQLHQLRGRVGRGAARSYCVLMVGAGGMGAEARQRLRVMEETTDGFRIARADFELRGPGVVFGTQQHGLSDLQFLSVVLDDPAFVECARAEAAALVEADAGVEQLLARLGGRWKRRLDLAQVG